VALGWTVGIDVGGTFTDAIALHRDGRTLVAKVASTPGDPSVGLLHALRELVREGVDARDVGLVFHGTTVATNAMLTGRTSRVVLLATEGFRDVMAFRDGTRPVLYDLRQPRPDPLVERDDRLEVHERTSSGGDAVVPLTHAEIERVVAEVTARRPEAVAIAFLFSHVRDDHERAVADAVREALPNVPVTASSDIAREFREYPRTATAVVNAGLRPIVGRYLEHAAAGLTGVGVDAPFLVMQSNGGCVPAERAEREAHRLLLSGPTAGVAATVALARRRGAGGVISFDMGGTSLDVCLVDDGGTVPTTSTQVVSDHPILVPSVDIETAGAGGGSIASVDRAGRLRVGPQSAGAHPGPAAYGRGGSDATLTDAHVVAGILGATPLAGRLELDGDRAHRAVEAVGRPLGLATLEAADGIIAVAAAHSVRAIRRVSVERGLDPRGYSLVAFGGAGPLMAGRMLAELGLGAVVVPPHPGLFSAQGLMSTSVRIDDAQTMLRPIAPGLEPELLAWYRAARARVVAQLRDDGIPASRVRVVASADCRYEGQGYELELPLGAISAASVRRLPAAFAQRHAAMYGHADPRETVEIVTARVSAFGDLERHVPEPVARGSARPPADARVSERRALVHGLARPARVTVYRRERLRARNVLAGPAIVEQMDSTTVIGRGQRATVDEEGNLWLRAAR
jgi:N-methylhydantoinase A